MRLLFGHYADKVAAHHDLDQAGNLAYGTLVHAGNGSADFRRTHHTPVNHSWHAHVMDKLKAAGHECNPVKCRNRLTHHLPFGGSTTLGCSAQRKIETLAADQLAIR